MYIYIITALLSMTLITAIWKIATTRVGRKWQRQKWLENFARDNRLNYTSSLVATIVFFVLEIVIAYNRF